jgi:hypothetical protein
MVKHISKWRKDEKTVPGEPGRVPSFIFIENGMKNLLDIVTDSVTTDEKMNQLR